MFIVGDLTGEKSKDPFKAILDLLLKVRKLSKRDVSTSCICFLTARSLCIGLP